VITHNEKFKKALMLSELELKDLAKPNDLEFLNSNLDLHLSVLKQQKSQVEYQFTSHKANMADYYHKLCSKDISLQQYTDLRKEQFLWKAKASSYLIAIENKINILKSRKNYEQSTS
jgi:hypothetical protein